MDEDDFPPEPTKVIQFGNHHIESVIRGQDVLSSKWYRLSGRFAYFAEYDVICIFDLFRGIEKKIVPKTSYKISHIWAYVQLSANRGFAVYETTTRTSSRTSTRKQAQRKRNPNFASILSIDFEDGTYEIVYSKLLKSGRARWQSISNPISNIVMFISINTMPNREYQYKLNICRLNPSFSKIEYYRSIDISNEYSYFHLIDGKIVFANIVRHNFAPIVKLMCISENNQFVEIENTSTTLKAYPSSEMIDLGRGMVTNNSCWHGSRFFYFYALYNIYLKDRKSRVVAPFLWQFEMETKEWSKINLVFPLTDCGYDFSVDYDGIVTFIKYPYDKKFGESESQKSSLIRIALKSPDKLSNMCWFQMRKAGFSELINVYIYY